jgi:NAD/NADP transhydrogenase beta subunit
VILTQLPIGSAAVVSSLGLASLIILCAYVSKAVYWWTGVGAIAGMIIGLGGIMAEHLTAEKEPIDLHLRLIMVVGQTLAGFISGVLLGRRIPLSHLPTLKDFLSSLSAVTVGLFAVIVTRRFIVDGLEPARTLSSRLSVSTTIVITLLAMPGALGYLLSQRHNPPSDR